MMNTIPLINSLIGLTIHHLTATLSVFSAAHCLPIPSTAGVTVCVIMFVNVYPCVCWGLWTLLHPHGTGRWLRQICPAHGLHVPCFLSVLLESRLDPTGTHTWPTHTQQRDDSGTCTDRYSIKRTDESDSPGTWPLFIFQIPSIKSHSKSWPLMDRRSYSVDTYFSKFKGQAAWMPGSQTKMSCCQVCVSGGALLTLHLVPSVSSAFPRPQPPSPFHYRGGGVLVPQHTMQ